MLRVGLTGGIASGKSEVARRLANAGAFVIDADRLAREVVAPGTPGHAAIVARFGGDVLRPDGSINRSELAAIVFRDADARSDLNAIVHPPVRALAAEREAAADRPIVVHDIPLLVETGQQDRFDAVVVVACTPDRQRQRLVEHRGMSEAAAAERIGAQAPLSDKIAVADFVIDNNGTQAELNVAVAACWTWLLALAAGRGNPPA